MPRGVAKRPAKRARTLALANLIDLEGVPMPSCSYCLSRGLACKVGPSSTRCGSCISAQQSGCDASFSPTARTCSSLRSSSRVLTSFLVNRVVAATKKVRSDKKKARAELRAAQDRFLQAQKRFDRLEEQEELLREKGAEMARRGFEELEEEEAAARASEGSEVPASSSDPSTAAVASSSVVVSEVVTSCAEQSVVAPSLPEGFGDSTLDPFLLGDFGWEPAWGDPGSFGGTAEGAPSSG